MKAFEHISERIDSVYKELTKGKASPMGGVAYLSLEESEVRRVLTLVLVYLTPNILRSHTWEA
jgi:chromosome segregation ATPase